MGSLEVLSLTTLYPNAKRPGAGLFVRSRLQHVAARGVDVRVLSPVALLAYRGEGSPWGASRGIPAEWQDERLTVVHSRWIYPPASGIVAAFCLFACALAPAVRLRRTFRFQLIDAHFGHPEGIAAGMLAAVFRVPFLVTLRGSEVDHARSRFRRAGMRWMLRRAARVITVSERLREFAIGLGAAPQRVITIPNGVDAATFYPRNREECRRRLGIAPEERLIVAAGHLIPLKGHHHMIRAVRALVDRGWNATLAIAGDAGASASHEDFLRSEVSRLGLEERVRFLGRKPPAAVAEYMSAADVFCLASSREGWPNVVHEALSCGTPVVATAVGAAPQMIPREEYGILLPPESVDRLDEPLERALAADWDRAAIAAWGRARSWEQVAEEVAAEMRAAAQGR